MISLQTLTGRIKILIASLTKKNFNKSLTEINQLLNYSDIYFTDTNMISSSEININRVPIITALLDELDFRDIRNISSKDEQKLTLLHEEIISALKKPNYIIQICQSFEGGNRQKLLPQGNKIFDDYLINLCRVLKFSPGICVSLAYTLTQSQYRLFSTDSLRILISKIPEVIPSGSISDINEDILRGLVQIIYNSEELSQSEVSGSFLATIKTMSSHPLLNQASAKTSNFESLEFNSIHKIMDNTRQRVNVAGILTDIGSQASSSVEMFRKTIAGIGLKIDEEQVAGILVAVLPRTNLSVDSEERKMELNPWNLEVVAEVLHQECRGYNWALVAKCLDNPALNMKSETDIQLLARLFVRVSGAAIPAVGILGSMWSNKPAQLIVLSCLTGLPRNIVDFSTMISAEQLIPGEIATPPNFSWLCIPLYMRLIDLANAGMPMEVLEIMSKGATAFPEYFLISLAQVQDPNSGVRSEFLRRLLPLFTGLQGSRPSSLAVMRKLSAVNPELLIILCRIAVKKAKKVWEVANIDQLLKSLGIVISRRLEEEGSADELLSLWCVKADRLELSLEEKVQTLLEINPKNARLFVSFAKIHAETLRPRAIHNQNDSILSFESFATLLRAVQAHPTIVPMEEVRALANVFAQQQQSFQAQQQHQQMYSMQGQQGQNISHTSNNSHSAMDHNENSNNFNSGGENSELSRLPPGPEAEEIEALANSYFQKIYTADFTIPDVILMLRQFKSSSEKREQEIFRCMIHNLFDEYRFFHKYPEKELQVTGRLFGALIQHQLVSSITLGIALRYVLEALRKDPELGEGNDKMFRFGRISLDQFRLRLGEWPQYCSHLVQIPHLVRHCPDMYQEIQKALNNPQAPSQQSSQPTMQQQMPQSQMSQHMMQQQHQMIQQMPQQQMMSNLQSVNPAMESSMSMQQMHSNNMNFANSTPIVNNSHIVNNADNVHAMAQQFSMMNTNSDAITTQNSLSVRTTEVDTKKATNSTTDSQVSEHTAESTPIDESTLVDHSLEIARMAVVNADVLNSPMPPDNIRDQIHFIVNNIAKNNFETKSLEIKEMLKPEYYNWFANYLVVKRISTQPNLHPLYLSVLDALDLNALVKLILDSSYHNVTKLLQSPNITTSSSERSLLRNLGVWLGQLTLARNKPLLQKRINLKELLFWGFETGRLIAVCSFVAKILEGVKESKVFRPPNPWLMALLGIMRELYEIEDLKLNIKFEVQVLCKNINIKIDDIPKGNNLIRCRMPVKDQRNPDFNLKLSSSNQNMNTSGPGISNSSPIVMQSTPVISTQPPQPPTPLMLPSNRINEEESKQMSEPLPPAAAPPVASAEAPQPANSLNQLAPSITISPSLQFFATNPNQRRLVLIAVERGIKEIIQSAVERSVSIASTTTKQIILKDFATEPNEQILRSGAHLMVSSLAGSLALATCKEPLRISIGNHLRTLLAQAISDQTVIEQIVQVCSNDNVDVGCALIEKASIEKSIREIDEALTTSIVSRRKHREAGQQFLDATIPTSGKYPAELHESLKPRIGGLLPQQLQIYEAFQRLKLVPSSNQSQTNVSTPSPSATVLSQTGSIDAMKSLPPANSAPLLNMSQALEAYQGYLTHIDIALKAVQAQAQGREVTVSMLGSDHELLSLMRNLIAVTQRTQPIVKIETAVTFSENLFNRMFESISSPDSLRLEIFVLMLESIKESCGGSKVFNPDFIAWLGKYAVLVSNDEASRRVYRLILILLLRAKLLRPNDIDMYFVVYIDGGRNLFWLELALSFIRQCLVEGLATIYDFTNTFETVTKMRPTNMVLKKQLQKWLTDIKTLTVAQEEQKAAATAAANGVSVPPSSSNPSTNPAPGGSVKDPAVREHVTLLLDRWLRVWNAVTDQIFSQYLQLMHQYGVLKTEEAADKFFRNATEICAEACVKNVQAATSPDQASTLNYTVIDALSKLFLLLVRLADKEATDMNVRVNLLSRILNAVARTLIEDHETKKNAKVQFDQRPYFRLLSNLSQDLGIPEAKQEVNPAIFPLLTSYTQIFLALQPSVVPGFAYAWVQLISRRSFMPNLLLIKGQKGWLYMHRLLSALLLFLQPFLKASQMNESIRKLYKGTLRILLVLLHDFPEFLCDFHLSFCELIPLNCVQLRNLVLSAFPRSMRLPDPFTPNLKIDVLPEISQSPRILTDYLAPISGIRNHIDTYISTKIPAELPNKLPAILTTASGSYNSSFITSLVMYVGSLAIMQVQNKIPIQNSPAMEIYKQLAIQLDAEGKYILFNIMANQLRYPNSHTHFFSYVILNLFLEAENEQIQEQITRVLLERLIVHRPHPWGLLITFIELIKVPKYAFWKKSFTRSAPEIERVFESIARSCIGASAPAIIQQQLSTN